MKAIVVRQSHDGPLLEWGAVPDVTYEPDEVLLDIRASAVNRADLSQARGNYAPPEGVTEILGLEASGVIEAVGAGVKGWQVGDRVCCLLPGGGYAQRVAAPGGMLLPLPDEWRFEEGAAVPEVWLTAFVNLFGEGGLKQGETVLIHAGGSGVGTAAIQLARAAGARVFTTAGSAEKLARCRELGAEIAVNYLEDSFGRVALEATEGRGVDLVLDFVGQSYWSENLAALAHGGRLVLIGFLGG